MPRSRDPDSGVSPLSPYLSSPNSSPTFAALGQKDKAPEVRFFDSCNPLTPLSPDYACTGFIFLTCQTFAVSSPWISRHCTLRILPLWAAAGIPPRAMARKEDMLPPGWEDLDR
ncbi:hypothetical protein PCH_Pc22g10050 [Penicillium rubens Wisconsin 54-1255]|uniref:Uncharacterized protein n=4 Tax=Penicillium chrysogenum species complex TaxID=254878 RepID=B6HV86_PENRW|nr:hypothetical protein PCH_Pc22g10050 [Penicillium rubens Wisconsin 54-1255]